MQSLKAKAKEALHHNHNGEVDDGKTTILVTGGSGFVAAHVLNAFLSRDEYQIRATVRSQSSGEKIMKTHAQYADRLSFVIVKDITTPGAFDEAVKDVDGVGFQRPYQGFPSVT
jgi:uncharacterized protein YbjT (DUF2867 family)